MSLNLAKSITSIILLFSVATVSAQTSESGSNPLSNKQNSPYSRYGFGDLRSGVNIAYRGMGSITSSVADPFTINTENPASYASLALTTYEIAGEGNSHRLRANNKTYATGMASLSYMNIAFPLGKHFGMALGIKPHSRMYYNAQDSVTGTNGIPGIGDAIRIYFGDGSINKAFIGFGGTVKGFSLGFNFGYMFGNTRTTSALVNIDTTTTMNTEISRYTNIGGVYYNIGALYTAKLNDKYQLNVGGTVSLSQNIGATRDEYWISYARVGGVSDYDTIYTTSGAKGQYISPLSYSLGVQLLGNQQWRVGVDFTGTQWSQFRNFGNIDSLQASTWRTNIGAEITPDAKSARKYLPRVSYRLGFYYGSDYIRLRNTDMSLYGVTVGLSLPFRKSPDRIHTALEVGSRGTTQNGLIRENFVKFTLGASLNAFLDKWFVKRKYD